MNENHEVIDETDQTDPVVQFISKQIRAFREKTQTPGVAIAVQHRGRSYLLHYGTATLTPVGPSPVKRDTMFAVGSVTKVFTATLLGYRFAQGSMHPGDPVSKYLPKDVTNPHLQAVTLRDLATHTSELQDSQFEDIGHISTQLFEGQPPSQALIKAWNQWRKKCKARIGTYWEYSNTGFVTLGFALSPCGDPSYGDQLQTEITGPLGMTRTLPGTALDGLSDIATGHRCEHGVVTPIASRATDLYSTSNDLLTWLKANLGLLPKVPAPLAAALRWAHGDPRNHDAPYFDGKSNVGCNNASDPKKFSMGLGWQISLEQPSVWAKDGATSLAGGTAWLGFIPADARSERTGLAIVTNLDGNDAASIGLELLRNLPST